MTSAFHRPTEPPHGDEPVRHRRVHWQLHPVLTSVLNRLDGTAIGQAFKDRAVDVSMMKVLGEPVNPAEALAPHRWLLERADGQGLVLTAAGYLKPTDVQALAKVLPTMRGWPFKMVREVDTRPVLWFREQFKETGLLRKYKGTLRLTRLGRDCLESPESLWEHLASHLVPTSPDFASDAAVVVLVHMATTEGNIDVEAVARTLTQLGWSYEGGAPIDIYDVHDARNDLWRVLGNVGDVPGERFTDRTLSAEARIMINQALFTETPGAPG